MGLSLSLRVSRLQSKRARTTIFTKTIMCQLTCLPYQEVSQRTLFHITTQVWPYLHNLIQLPVAYRLSKCPTQTLIRSSVLDGLSQREVSFMTKTQGHWIGYKD